MYYPQNFPMPPCPQNCPYPLVPNCYQPQQPYCPYPPPCPPSYCPTEVNCCNGGVDRNTSLLARFAKGYGDYRPDVCYTPCCPLPPLKPFCPKRTNYNCGPPPVMIQKGKINNPCCKRGPDPSEKLKNLDMVEELCYFSPETNSYCGGGGVPGSNQVKYTRRQRFCFDEDGAVKIECPPPCPPPPPCVKYCPVPVPCCPPPVPCCAVPVPCCPGPSYQPCCQQSSNQSMGQRTDNHRKGSRRSAETPPAPTREKILPKETGIYYYDATNKTFIPERCLPKPPEVIFRPPDPQCVPRGSINNKANGDNNRASMDSNSAPQNRPQQPFIQEFEILEEDEPEQKATNTVQPIIQPVIMPPPGNNQYNNPGGNNGQSFGNPNPCGNNGQSFCNPNPPGIMPMCIPMCPQQQYFPPMFPPGPPPGMYGSGYYSDYGSDYDSRRRKNKRKDKKDKGKRKSSEDGDEDEGETVTVADPSTATTVAPVSVATSFTPTSARPPEPKKAAVPPPKKPPVVVKKQSISSGSGYPASTMASSSSGGTEDRSR